MKISTVFIAEIEKATLKFIWNLKGLQIPKTVLKKEQSWRTHTSKLQNLLQNCSIQDIVVLAKEHIDQWNRSLNIFKIPFISKLIHI